VFNPLKYYESRGIEYHLPPEKNVTRGWVNINCPFPECDDPSWHCGVDVRKEKFNCYICGNKGHVSKLIKEIERCSGKRAWAIFKSFKGGDVGGEEFGSPPFSSIPPLRRTTLERFEWPRGIYFLKEFSKKHIRYLVRRGYESNVLVRKYKLLATGHVGDYNFRIIIPFFEDGKIITFTSRDITDEQGIRYLDCPIDLSVHHVNYTLYNIDSVRQGGCAVIVEGVFDVWRVGDGAVASSTTSLTNRQLELLQEKELKRCVVMFDAGKIELRKARKIADNLTSFIPDVKLIRLDRGDPDSSLRKVDVKRVRRLIDG